jgi:hypothetical protein
MGILYGLRENLEAAFAVAVTALATAETAVVSALIGAVAPTPASEK